MLEDIKLRKSRAGLETIHEAQSVLEDSNRKNKSIYAAVRSVDSKRSPPKSSLKRAPSTIIEEASHDVGSNNSPKKDSFIENAPHEFVITPRKAGLKEFNIPEQGSAPQVEDIDDPASEKEVNGKKDAF